MQPEESRKVAVVAGATGGIGAEVCRLLVQGGWSVIGVGRSAAGLDNLAAELGEGPGRFTACRADLETESGWERVLDRFYPRLGRIDALVNCVGIIEQNPISSASAEDVGRMIRVNINTVIHGARAVLPAMTARGAGVIVTVGSLGGMVPMPERELYSAVKFAVRGFSLSLDATLRGTGVRACLLEPGPVFTRALEREAIEGGNALAFCVAPIEAMRAARAIVRLIAHPRTERVLPGWSSVLSRLVGAFPGLHSVLLPILNRLGTARLARLRLTLRCAVQPGRGCGRAGLDVAQGA